MEIQGKLIKFQNKRIHFLSFNRAYCQEIGEEKRKHIWIKDYIVKSFTAKLQERFKKL